MVSFVWSSSGVAESHDNKIVADNAAILAAEDSQADTTLRDAQQVHAATAGGNVVAQIFYLKSRAQWRDVQALELFGSIDGGEALRARDEQMAIMRSSMVARIDCGSNSSRRASTRRSTSA